MPQNLDSKSEILHAQQQPVEFITLSGGGARGVIYSGVLAALTQKDSKTASVMDGVKAIAGSSAGAITAALIATGIDPIDFETLSKTTNFKDLLGTEGVGMFNKDGKPLYKLMQKTILQNVKKFLDGKDISQNESKGLQDLKVRLDV